MRDTIEEKIEEIRRLKLGRGAVADELIASATSPQKGKAGRKGDQVDLTIDTLRVLFES